MKIAMVSADGSPLDEAAGPHGAYVDGLSAALCRDGHEVAVYTRRDHRGAPARVRTDRGYELVHVPAGPAERLADEDALPHIGAFTSSLLREWATSPPDVVHGHRWVSGMVSVLGGRRISVPVVQTFHSLAAAEQRHCTTRGTGPEQRRKLEVLVGREVAHVAAGSSSEAFELLNAGVHRSAISVVPSGVDIDAFTPDGPEARRGRPHRVVLTGTQLTPRHVDAVISALFRVDGAELVVAGLPLGRPGGDPAAAKARDVDAGPRVAFTGPVARSAMPALLRSADVVVCASSYEPSSAIALEAMACGVPVVATAVDALADVVVDGVTGLLVPPGEQVALSRALRSLLLNDTLRNEFAVAGRDRVTARYSWDRVAADFLRLYEQAGARTAGAADPVHQASASEA
ncbi:glycosyltransferase [Lentzea cavernae]|uniref:Glycosyl transferase n=1 Tax=Lentzea cavernae TaxID=2020703 RepID=A0ABQ3MDA0_9PSEU|nr:glycosyltransferase [Lentzea cavernae]GHH40616.1 glycosyl transferase [Lentzea cavernae]